MESPEEKEESNTESYSKEQENENYPLRTMDIIDNVSDKIEKSNENRYKNIIIIITVIIFFFLIVFLIIFAIANVTNSNDDLYQTTVYNPQRKTNLKKVFPGYVLVKMIVTEESWYIVRNTRGVTGFVGSGTDPIPLTDEEIRNMGFEQVPVNVDYDVSDNVQVVNGPLEGFVGTVQEINKEKQKVKVLVSMFGRETPVELEFSQVQKIN